ncbi:hypothetical protein Fmac_008104 [Flemingia macrophylla]|uniref:Ribosomal protein L20 n=1 Tax=Flemingia macrophylla TaxID=520843 RepID=A0ABD1MWJ5_9FABA
MARQWWYRKAKLIYSSRNRRGKKTKQRKRGMQQFVGLDIRRRTTVFALQHANLNALDETNNISLNSGLLVGSMSVCYTSLKKCSSLTTSTKAHFSCIDQSKEADDEVTNVTSSSQRMEFNSVDCVVWLLHRSSRSFSQAIRSLGLPRSGPALAMAWIGKDVHEWYRRTIILIEQLIQASVAHSNPPRFSTSPMYHRNDILLPIARLQLRP